MSERGSTPGAARRAGENIARMLLNNTGVFVVNFVTTVLISRLLLPEGKGLYSLTILIPLTLANVGNLGLPLALTHYVGKQPDRAPRLMANGTILALVAGVAYSAAFLAFDHFEPLGLFANLDTRYKVMAICILPLLLWNHFASSVLLGLDRQRLYRYLRLAEAVALLIGIVAGLGALHGGLAAAIGAWLGSRVVVTVLSGVALRRARALGTHPDAGLLRQCLRFGAQGWGGIVASFLLLRSDLFLVNYFRGAEAVGHYSVSSALFLLLALLPMSAFTSFLPQATRTEAAAARNVTCMTSRILTATCTGLALLSVLPVKYLVVLVFGAAYAPAVTPLLVLLPALTLLGAGAITNAALQGIGQVRYHSYSNGAALILNIGLNLWWIPRWGIAGAAAASTIAYLGMACIQVLAYANAAHVRVADLLILRPDDVRLLRATLARKLGYQRVEPAPASTTPG